jgi:hypothetical protein
MRHVVPIAFGVLLLAACDAHAQSSSSSSASSSSSGGGGTSAAVTTHNGETTIVTSDGRRCHVVRGHGGDGTSSSVTRRADGSLSSSTRAGNTGVHVESGNGRSNADCYVDEHGKILEDR